MYKKVKGKLFSLFTGELFAAVMFAVLWIMYLRYFEWTEPYLTSVSSLYAFLLLEFILFQASYYWFLKWNQVKRNNFSHLPFQKLKLFLVFKWLNLAFIAMGLFFLIYQITEVPIDFYWFIFLYVFAIVEHINYYHIRLSYLSMEEMREFIHQKGFRKSKLARELNHLRKFER